MWFLQFQPVKTTSHIILPRPSASSAITSQVTEIVVKSSKPKSQKFMVVEVDSSTIVYDVKGWWPQFYKRNLASEETKKKRKNLVWSRNRKALLV